MKLLLSLALLSLITGSFVVAQQQDDATRKLWDTAFIATSTNKTKAASHRRSSRRYRIATPNVPIDNVVPESVVGVTIWRLRPAGRADSGERIIVDTNEITYVRRAD